MISLSQTKYFYPDQLKILQRNGIRSIQELLLYIPKRYIDRSRPLNLEEEDFGEIVTFVGQIIKKEVKYGRKRRLIITCRYQSCHIEVIFFQGISYYQDTLQPGLIVAFSGKLAAFTGKLSMVHPEFEIVTEEEMIHTGKITSFYKITDGMRKVFITTKILRKVIHDVLSDYTSKLKDFLDEVTLKQFDLLSIGDALRLIHFPEKMRDVDQAKKRLAFDEILVFAILMRQKQQERKKIIKKHIPSNNNKGWAQTLVNSLPFKLTESQNHAIQTLQNLAYKKSPFAALLQGDVGSGKTIVVIILALHYLESGLQVALMAPTEVLAKQHYKNILRLFSLFPFLPIEIFLGGEKKSEKESKIERIKNGNTLLIVGTHSLLQEKLTFAELGLVVIDEQHRFGVEQREKLRSKSKTPDLLTMTATPIPRSLTLTLYGDLEAVQMNQKPEGRLPIETKAFPETELNRLYEGVKKYVKQGQQAYIVYPLIDESDKLNRASLKSEYDALTKKIFKGYSLGLIHSQLPIYEKEMNMGNFARGETQILVCTTVIEVGVDVPNATVILIRDADKFGLSQLHQLRGRVGRDDKQSFCILVHPEEITKEAKMRLTAMMKSNDGFYLAQKDLEIRGTGELMGVRQAGISEFRIADLRYHYKLVEQATGLIRENPNVAEEILSEKDWKKFLKKGMILFGN